MNYYLKFFLTVLCISVLSGCTQEQGEILVKQSWGFLKYGWLIPFASGLICFARGNGLLGGLCMAVTVFGLIMWWVYYLMACPEFCALI